MDNRRKCVIVDIDGTVALMRKGQEGKRGPYDWDRVDEDDPNWDVIELVQLLILANRAQRASPFFPDRGFDLVMVSGRKEQCRARTKSWLAGFGIIPALLLMRPDSDNRPDHELKLEILQRDILPLYNVMFAIDDRDAVVKMWRDQGITCLQVAEGAF